MSLSAEQHRYLKSYVDTEPGLTYTRQRTLQCHVRSALAELDRLQATADRRGELLRRALPLVRWVRLASHPEQDIVAAIVAELAGEGDGS